MKRDEEKKENQLVHCRHSLCIAHLQSLIRNRIKVQPNSKNITTTTTKSENKHHPNGEWNGMKISFQVPKMPCQTKH